MNKFNEVNINIKKALITKVSISLKEENGQPKPSFDVFATLMTEEGKSVSDMYFGSDWFLSDDKKLEIPVELHLKAAEFFKLLTPIMYAKLNDTYKQLTDMVKVADVEGEIVEEPNLDDIPF